MSKPPQGTLTTRFGTMTYCMTNAHHVCLLGILTVNRVECSVRVELFNAGSWGLHEYRDLIATRTDRYENISIAARRVLSEELPKVWADCVTETMLRDADLADAIEARDQANDDLERAKRAYEDAQDAYEAARMRVTVAAVAREELDP